MESLMKYIGRTSRCASVYRSKEFKKLEINEYQHPYIMYICKNPGVNQEMISSEIFVNKSNVTRQLATLEEKGFITRTPSITDKREIRVFPTKKAENIYPIIRKILKKWNDEILEGLTVEEKSSILLIMKKIQEKASKVIEL